MPTRDDILQALASVRDPRSGRTLPEAGLVQGLVAGPDRAGFMLEVAPADAALYEPVRAQAETALRALPGVERVHVALTAERAGSFSTAARSRPAAAPPRAAAPAGGARPPHVKRVVAVASGKGGVGKSTVAVNLACAFARLGLATGLLDADVYGPSAPRMLGLSGEKPRVDDENKLLPLSAWGVRVASIGFLVDEGAPMIWRGPMASSAVGQLLNDVRWGAPDAPLDLLVVDMPPGTGDVQLTLAQKVTTDGAVIVSTPQEVALIDVRRGAAMFEKTATPILGVVENMSYFPDPATGAPIPIFGHGGARAVAQELHAPFLGEVPIDMALRAGGDDGRPLVATDPDGPGGRAFMAIAEAVLDRLEAGAGAKPAPRIVVTD
ncbi:MAG: Mrp/NBP35 family ATP-binding protein [Caulobacteraceae bacterium]|nr:Mrp/NBP35 family ATP-binding protein [Caulobacter sp.]